MSAGLGLESWVVHLARGGARAEGVQARLELYPFAQNIPIDRDPSAWVASAYTARRRFSTGERAPRGIVHFENLGVGQLALRRHAAKTGV